MTSIIEVLYARRPIINYVTPSACETPLSSSGIALLSIFLPSLFAGIGQMDRPFVYGTAPGPFSLDWTSFPGAICYNVYQVIAGQLVLIHECIAGGPITIPPGDYVVTPITPDGEGPPSVPGSTDRPDAPEAPNSCVNGWRLLGEITPNGVLTWFGGSAVYLPGHYKVVVKDGNFASSGSGPGGWQFVETMNPQISLTWFNGGNPLPAGNYKLEYVTGYLFDAPFSLCGENFYEQEISFRLRWNDGSNQVIEPWGSQGCFTNAEDLVAALQANPFSFVHSSGRIGLNPDGGTETVASLYVAVTGSGCVGFQFPANYTVEWNDGTSAQANPWTTNFTCYPSLGALDIAIPLTPRPIFEFDHLGGRIGSNPDGQNKLTLELYVQCV